MNHPWPQRIREAVQAHPERMLYVIVLGAVLFHLPFLDGTLTSSDAWRQADTATIARNFLETPWILWPRIDWAAPGPGYVEAEFQLYPFTVSLLYRLFGENPIYGQLLSVGLSAMSLLVFHRIARRFLTDGPALVAVALLALSPIMFRYSGAFMPEATVLLFYLLALERFLTFLDDRRWSTALLAGTCTALAILVKPTSIHLGLVFLILLVSRDGWRSLGARKPLAIATVALLPACAYYAHAVRIHATYGNTFGVISGGDSKWGSLTLWASLRFWENLGAIDAAWMTGPVGAILAVYALVAARTAGLRTMALAWGLSLVLYYCIVGRYAGEPTRGVQYHIYAAPFFALLTACGLDLLRRRAADKPLLLALTAVAVFGFQIAIDGVIATRPRRTAYMRAAGLKLEELSKPGDVVVVLSEAPAVEGAIPNNYEQPNLFFHARRRGRVLASDQQNAHALGEILGTDARWFVNYPELNEQAEPSFGEALAGMPRVFVGERFEIYAIDADAVGARRGSMADAPLPQRDIEGGR